MLKQTVGFSAALLLLASALTGCGGTGTSLSTAAGTISVGNAGGTTANASIPTLKYFAVVVLENTNYLDAYSPSNMPYLYSLGQRGSLATNYYADLHPSIGNYMILTTGIPATVDDSYTGVISVDNVARQLTSAGKTWKAYAESIPAPGYLGGDAGPYLRHHNPFSYFSDAQQPPQSGNIVPFTQLAIDLRNNSLPNYLFIVPDATHDAHSCFDLTTNCPQPQRLAAADQWLQTNIQPLLNDPNFSQNGVLVITFDESANDLSNGGGKVVTILLGSHVKTNYQGTGQYDHRSLLNLSLRVLGIPPGLNGSSAASQMAEFFQ